MQQNEFSYQFSKKKKDHGYDSAWGFVSETVANTVIEALALEKLCRHLRMHQPVAKSRFSS